MSLNGNNTLRFDPERLWARMVERGQATQEDIDWRRQELERQRKEEANLHGGHVNGSADSKLPPLVYGDAVAHKVIVLPEEIISGMLHRGAKMVLGGGSKSFKTWCLIDLAISIATGRKWWGRDVRQGKVVYLNLEVQGEFFETRMQHVAHAKGCTLPADLIIWNLRGYCSDHRTLIPELIKRLAGMQLSAIVLDPTYKVMSGSENAQEEVAALMDSIEKMALATGAAVIFGSHFAKGNASGKEAIDRISGSGVFARDPDAILTMTPHEEKEAFVIDAILRNCPPVDSFCVRWIYPLMRHAPELNSADLKASPKPGKKANDRVPSVAEVVEVVEAHGGKMAGGEKDENGLIKVLMDNADCTRENAKKAVGAALCSEVIEPQTGVSNKRLFVLKPSPATPPKR